MYTLTSYTIKYISYTRDFISMYEIYEYKRRTFLKNNSFNITLRLYRQIRIAFCVPIE